MQPRTPLDRTEEVSHRRQSRRLQNARRSSSAPVLPHADEPASSPSAARKTTKRRSAALQDITNTNPRKRADASSPSDDSVHSAKTNKRIKETTTVTPITMTGKEKSIFPCHDFDTLHQPSQTQKPIPEAIPLPAGVVDLYPRDNLKLCTCDENHCSSRSLSHSFLRHYGPEYYKSLREWEETYFGCPGTSGKSNASSSSSVSLPSSQGDETSSHRGTPPRRVNYVFRNVGDDGQQSLSSSISSQALLHQPHLTEKMREVLVDWMIELSEEYHLSTKTLHLTIALLNRALERGKDDDDGDGAMPFVVGRDMFQCLGCACMWMASKIEEVISPSVEDFVYISADSYCKQDITEMELAVCDALEFRLYQVTPHDFVEELLRASNADRRLIGCPIIESDVERFMVEYLLELSLLSFSLSTAPPRLVAAAAMYLSRITLGLDGWSPTLEHVSGMCQWDLEDVVMTIYKYYATSEESKLTNAFLKYSKASYDCVALKTVPWANALGF